MFIFFMKIKEIRMILMYHVKFFPKKITTNNNLRPLMNQDKILTKLML